MTGIKGKIFDFLLISGGFTCLIVIIWACFTQEIIHYEEPKNDETIQIQPIFIINYIEIKGENPNVEKINK